VLGRSGFVWRVVVARLAIPVAVLATLLRALTEPFAWMHFTAHVVANFFAAVLGGYVGGRILWALVVSRGGRTR
jgi:hypothetical protein